MKSPYLHLSAAAVLAAAGAASGQLVPDVVDSTPYLGGDTLLIDDSVPAGVGGAAALYGTTDGFVTGFFLGDEFVYEFTVGETVDVQFTLGPLDIDDVDVDFYIVDSVDVEPFDFPDVGTFPAALGAAAFEPFSPDDGAGTLNVATLTPGTYYIVAEELTGPEGTGLGGVVDLNVNFSTVQTPVVEQDLGSFEPSATPGNRIVQNVTGTVPSALGGALSFYPLGPGDPIGPFSRDEVILRLELLETATIEIFENFTDEEGFYDYILLDSLDVDYNIVPREPTAVDTVSGVTQGPFTTAGLPAGEYFIIVEEDTSAADFIGSFDIDLIVEPAGGLVCGSSRGVAVDVPLGQLTEGTPAILAGTTSVPDDICGYRNDAGLFVFPFITPGGDTVYSFTVDQEYNNVEIVAQDTGTVVTTTALLLDGLGFTPSLDALGDGISSVTVADNTIGVVDGPSGSFQDVTVVPGVTYYLVIDNTSTAAETFFFNLEVSNVGSAPPAEFGPPPFAEAVDLGSIGDNSAPTLFTLCDGSDFDTEIGLWWLDSDSIFSTTGNQVIVDGIDDGCGIAGGPTADSIRLPSGDYVLSVSGFDTVFDDGFSADLVSNPTAGGTYGGAFGSAAVGPVDLSPLGRDLYTFTIDDAIARPATSQDLGVVAQPEETFPISGCGGTAIDTVVALFDDEGFFLGQFDEGCPGGEAGPTSITATLPAGRYFLLVSTDGLDAAGPFSPNFTATAASEFGDFSFIVGSQLLTSDVPELEGFRWFSFEVADTTPAGCNAADLNTDGLNTLDDILVFTGAFDVDNPSDVADLNNDGENTLDDILVFTGIFDTADPNCTGN